MAAYASASLFPQNDKDHGANGTIGDKTNLVLFQELPRLWLIFSALMWLTERHDKTEARGSVAGLM